jgi:hypothetical protein
MFYGLLEEVMKRYKMMNIQSFFNEFEPKYQNLMK